MSEHKEMTSEELIAGARAYYEEHGLVQKLAQRLEEARAAMRQVINDCDDCWDNERCSVHRELELELQK